MKEKIDLLIDLEEKEKGKLSKFYATLALNTYEEMENIIKYLNSKSIKITKVNQLKIFGNTLEEIQNKFNVLEQIEAANLLEQNPININKNIIDIYKRINYCIQFNINYKTDDGAYKNFLFNSLLWKDELSKHDKQNVEESIVEEKKIIEPIIDTPSESPSIATNDKKEDYFEKIRAELEATRKALYNEFQSLDVNEEHNDQELISFDELDDLTSSGREM